LFAPVAPWLARKIGTERTILVLMAALSTGLLIRGAGNVSGLVVGSIVIGSAIAIINVLLPGLIKRDFAKITGLMAGLYSMALLSGAATAAGFTLALQSTLGGGWTTALALWSVPAAAACACWLFQLPKGSALAPRLRRAYEGVALRASLATHAVHGAAIDVFVYRVRLARPVSEWTGDDAAGVQRHRLQFNPATNGRLSARAADSHTLAESILVQCGCCGAHHGRFLGCLSAPLDTVWLWGGVQGIGQVP
jgi:CP family cyanate transporter-like MFS transporter